MKISDFNIKIKFEKKEALVDEIGNHMSQWNPYLESYAYPSYEGLGERVFLGAEIDHSDMAFTTRYSKAIDKINTSEYRIIFRDEIYNIRSIDHMNYKNKYVKFRCEKVAR